MAPEPDPLDDLRIRLRETHEAARRLAADVPVQGWATPDERDATAEDVRALVAILHTLRDVLPEELWDQAREVIRQLLLLLQAILDLAVARLDEPSEGARPRTSRTGASPDGAGSGPQDIPIA